MNSCEDCGYKREVETPIGIMQFCGFIHGEEEHARPINCPYGLNNEQTKDNKQ